MNYIADDMVAFVMSSYKILKAAHRRATGPRLSGFVAASVDYHGTLEARKFVVAPITIVPAKQSAAPVHQYRSADSLGVRLHPVFTQRLQRQINGPARAESCPMVRQAHRQCSYQSSDRELERELAHSGLDSARLCSTPTSSSKPSARGPAS